MVRPPQDVRQTPTDGDTSATRGAGLLGGPILLFIVGGVIIVALAVALSALAA